MSKITRNQPVYHFDDEYLERCKELSSEEILLFLENFRLLQSEHSIQNCMKVEVPNSLFELFKTASKLEGVKYQTPIKKLMQNWLES